MKDFVFKFFGIILILTILVSCKNEFDEAKEDEEIKIQNYINENNYTDIQKTENDLYYYEFKEGTGKQVEIGDFISIAINGTRIENDFDPDIADSNFTFIVGDNPMINGIDEGVQLMKEGSSGRFIIPFKLAYYTPTSIDGNYDTYIFDITINDIIDDIKQWELNNINEYLSDSINSKISDSVDFIVPDPNTGFCYIPLTSADGDSAEIGDIVYINYIGSFLDGRIFDDSYEYELYSSQLDTTKFIKGFVEGLTKMRVGEEAIFIIPYSLGYGANYNGTVIPSYSTLVFKINLQNIQ